MKSHEHRAVGCAAAGDALVQIGGDAAEEGFVLGYGDVVALSGDYFRPDELFRLAAIPGQHGTKPGTRDEIICALKVMAVDEAVLDARFEPGGQFAHYRFTATAATTEVERQVRSRYLALAATNGDHFVAPDQPNTTHSSGYGSAVAAYRRLHQLALDEAYRLGRGRQDESRAMAKEAAAQHYLTDAFAAGHLRTAVTAIRRFWHHRYPRFWQGLQQKVAADMVVALRQLTRPARMIPDGVLYRRALAAVQARTTGYPPISLGDLLARVFHDWDNDHGLILEAGGILFGDGHLDQGVGKKLAIAAVRAGIDDINVAYRLGVSGSSLCGQELYRAVQRATGAPHDTFAPETRIPTPSAGNPAQNWWAADIETLWNTPIVGATGTTVGMAVEQTLHMGTVSRWLDRPGSTILDVPGLLDMPALRRWAARKATQAYQHGFIQGLTHNPKATVLAIIDNNTSSCARHSRRVGCRRCPDRFPAVAH